MNDKFPILIGIALIAIVAIVGFIIYTSEVKTPGDQTSVEHAQTEVLRSFLDLTDQLSGIQSGAVFNFEVVDRDGRSANFGIWRADNGARLAKEHMVIFQETGTPANNISEVDIATRKVVAMRRTPVYFKGEKPADELLKIAEQFMEKIMKPNFAQEMGLEFLSDRKGENYFFRWNDKRFALPKGVEMDMPPFIQAGITSSGYIFSYDNTIQLYANLSKQDLKKICAFVEMPQTDDSMLDPEKGIIKIWFNEYNPFQNKYLVLPYEPETDFEGCSESAKAYLRHLPNNLHSL